MMFKQMVLIALAAGLAAGCSSERDRAAAATASVTAASPVAVDLRGVWDFEVDVGESITKGEFTLEEDGGAYTGSITPQGTNTLPVRSLTLDRDRVEMTVESGEGPVVFTGRLDAGGRRMSGNVAYHHGQVFPMVANRR